MKSVLAAALHYLSYRQLTCSQLETRLAKEGFASSEIETAVEKLKAWNYLDDRYYALTYCKKKAGKYSRARIKNELLKDGIDEDLVIEVLKEGYPEDLEYEGCKSLAEKVFKAEKEKWEKKYKDSVKYRGIPRELLVKNKTGQKLSQKGYPYELIKRVLEEIANPNRLI